MPEGPKWGAGGRVAKRWGVFYGAVLFRKEGKLYRTDVGVTNLSTEG
jgi:hypothetical protein